MTPNPPLDPPPHPDPLVAALAGALAGLRPAPAVAEKPAFLFRAGQASREALARRWRVLAVVAGVALVGSWAFWFARYSDAVARAEIAERRVAELTAVARPAPEPPPVPEPPPSPISSPVLLSVPALPPPPPYDPYPEPDATPQELADALRLRNDILLGGLTMLPEAKSPTGVRTLPLPGGVFATPQLEPKKLPPILPDDDD